MGTTARRVGTTTAAWAVTSALTLGATLGLLVTGAGTAFADDPAPTTQGPIILNAEQATYVCGTRIPAILSRVDRLTTRINADADTLGSTAWLKVRHDRAQAAGHADVADRIQKRIDGRADVLSRLSDAKQRATDFRDGNCSA